METLEWDPYEQTMTYFYTSETDFNAVDIRNAKFACGDTLCILSTGARYVIKEDQFSNRYLQKT